VKRKNKINPDTKLRIVTWKWKGSTIHPKKKIYFTSEHVNKLVSMLKRHLSMPYEVVCITDDPAGLDPSVRPIELWKDFAHLGGCYRRLKLFSKEMSSLIGPRMVSIDLDLIICGDVTPLFSRAEDFIIWGEHEREHPYCGALWIMDAGCRPDVWDTFTGKDLPDKKGGTDQAVINKLLYPYEMMWTKDNGIYNYNRDVKLYPKQVKLSEKVRRKERIREIESVVTTVSAEAREQSKKAKEDKLHADLRMKKMITKAVNKKVKDLEKKRRVEADQFLRVYGRGGTGKLPDNARIIFFNGSYDPSQPELQAECPWVKEHWR